MARICPGCNKLFDHEAMYCSAHCSRQTRRGRCDKIKPFGLKIGVVLVMAPTLLVIIALLWLSTASEATALSAESVAIDKPATSDSKRAVCEKPFEAILARHNHFKAEFARWRNLVAEHADAFTELVKGFPNGKNLNAEHLCQVFSHPRECVRQIRGDKVFAPWTGRWCGTWSNGVPQYHVWRAPYVCGDQWIQPVSLSEYGFTCFHRVEQKLQSGQADIAINVFSQEMGITGWVSKWQNGRAEMPHIGYLINRTTLVWFCQIRNPEELSKTDDWWFVFLETVNRATNPKEYRIYGVYLVVGKTVAVSGGRMSECWGTYYSFTEYASNTQTNMETNHGY